MSFRFEPAADAPKWDATRYDVFFDKINDVYPNVEQAVRQGLRVEAPHRGGKPKVKEVIAAVIATRALTQNGLRAVQLSRNQLVVNYMPAEIEPYPGFLALLDEAMVHFHLYVDCYQPVGVREVAIHYIDIVALPFSAEKVLRTEEYLTLDFKVPAAGFGSFAAFEINALVVPPGSKEPVQLAFATLPAEVEDAQRKFRLEWHTATRSACRIDEGEVRARMRTAHDRLEKCFRHAFTEKGWALFEPDEQ